MKLDESILSRLNGTTVFELSLGVGTFLNIYSKDDLGNKYQTWIYLACWAITKDGNELCSSDSLDTSSQKTLDNIVTKGIEHEAIIVLDSEEFHIIFSNNIVIEVWADPNEYGNGAELALFFCNDKFIAEIRSGFGMA